MSKSKRRKGFNFKGCIFSLTVALLVLSLIAVGIAMRETDPELRYPVETSKQLMGEPQGNHDYLKRGIFPCTKTRL